MNLMPLKREDLEIFFDPMKNGSQLFELKHPVKTNMIEHPKYYSYHIVLVTQINIVM